MRPHQLFKSLSFLGTGSMMPMVNKMCSSALLTTQLGNSLLLDCGEGTTLQLQKMHKKITKISHILITHLHGDHFFGIFGVLSSLSNMSPPNSQLTIVGPIGIKNIVSTVCNISPEGHIFGESNLRIRFKELYWMKNKSYLLDDICSNLKISAHPLVHTLSSFGYTIEELQNKKIDTAKAQALGLPRSHQIYSEILKGNNSLYNGQLIKAKDLVYFEEAKKIVFLQDTCNSESAVEKAMNCDVLVHECTLGTREKKKAIERGHSTSGMAGVFAKKVNAAALFLTHISQKIKYNDAEKLEQLRREAAEECPGTEVFAARDLMEVVWGKEGELGVSVITAEK